MTAQNKKVTRQELFEAVWSKPLNALVREWNTTYTQLVEACEKMKVPRPASGHWQMVARGLEIDREMLPEPTADVVGDIELLPPGVRREAPRKDPSRSPVVTQHQITLTSSSESHSEGNLALPPQPRPGGSETACRAERGVLDMIRQAVEIDFWRESISECHSPSWFGEWCDLKEGAKLSAGKILTILKSRPQTYRTFEVKVEKRDAQNEWSEPSLAVSICLRDDFEWKDAWEEAWSYADSPNPHCLSDNALKLFQWAKSPKNTGKIIERNIIGAQARLRETYSHIEEHLKEIRLKADPTIHWEMPNGSWRGPVRVWFGQSQSRYYHYGPLNPTLRLDISSIKHEELNRFKNWLHAEVMSPGFPERNEIVGIFDIRDRKTLKLAISKLPHECGRFGSQAQFFDALRLIDGLQIRRGFEPGAGPWLVICQPEPGLTWKEIKARLAAKRDEIPLEQKYDLSDDSRALLRWILDLRSRDYVSGMTPPVEEHLEVDIGIKIEWNSENQRARVELMVDEINEKTEFHLKTISWHHCGKELTRILVKRKKADVDTLVSAIRIFGLTKNKLLKDETVRAALEALMAPDS